MKTKALRHPRHMANSKVKCIELHCSLLILRHEQQRLQHSYTTIAERVYEDIFLRTVVELFTRACSVETREKVVVPINYVILAAQRHDQVQLHHPQRLRWLFRRPRLREALLGFGFEQKRPDGMNRFKILGEQGLGQVTMG